VLPNGQEAWELLAEEQQALRQRPLVICQLYNQPAGGKEEMLIQYLPHPSPSQLLFDQGSRKFVTEMIVYL
jgi:hypothetical protein